MLEELQQTIGKYRTVNSIVSKAGRLVKSDAEAPPAPKETRKAADTTAGMSRQDLARLATRVDDHGSYHIEGTASYANEVLGH